MELRCHFVHNKTSKGKIVWPEVKVALLTAGKHQTQANKITPVASTSIGILGDINYLQPLQLEACGRHYYSGSSGLAL